MLLRGLCAVGGAQQANHGGISWWMVVQVMVVSQGKGDAPGCRGGSFSPTTGWRCMRMRKGGDGTVGGVMAVKGREGKRRLGLILVEII